MKTSASKKSASGNLAMIKNYIIKEAWERKNPDMLRGIYEVYMDIIIMVGDLMESIVKQRLKDADKAGKKEG